MSKFKIVTRKVITLVVYFYVSFEGTSNVKFFLSRNNDKTLQE
jgi:hypothetical protein